MHLSAGTTNNSGHLNIGPRFEHGVIEASGALDKKIVAAFGISPLLAGLSDGDGAARREAYRQFLHGPLAALAGIVEAEASAKFGMAVTVSLDGIFAANVQGRGRAFKSLVDGGMDRADAMHICGFSGENDNAGT